MQQVSFPYEIVIGEDCSTDDTRRIVTEYRDRYPEVIRAFLRERNIGMNANCIATLRACKGRYVAMLEGDDYWLPAEKLQKQIDFLEAHPEFAICAGHARVSYEVNVGEPWEHAISKRLVFQLDDLLRENFIPTCTATFRLGLLLEFPAWYEKLAFGDWPLHVLVAQHGDIGVLPETLAVYRVHAGGTWINLNRDQVIRAITDFYDSVASYLPPRYATLIESLKSDVARRYSGHVSIPPIA